MEQYVCLFDFGDIIKDTLYYCDVSFDGKKICVYKTNDMSDIDNWVGVYISEYFITLARFRQIRIDEIINGDYEG